MLGVLIGNVQLALILPGESKLLGTRHKTLGFSLFVTGHWAAEQWDSARGLEIKRDSAAVSVVSYSANR